MQTQNPTASLVPLFKAALENMTAHHLERLGGDLGRKSSALRELFQKSCMNEIRGVIARLRDQKPLTETDVDLIRRWIIGDADYYSKAENNVEDWKRELSRLGKTVEAYAGKQTLTTDECLKLQAVVQDARLLISGLVYFVNALERVKRFESAVSDGIDRNEAKILADNLERMLISPDI